MVMVEEAILVKEVLAHQPDKEPNLVNDKAVLPMVAEVATVDLMVDLTVVLLMVEPMEDQDQADLHEEDPMEVDTLDLKVDLAGQMVHQMERQMVAMVDRMADLMELLAVVMADQMVH